MAERLQFASGDSRTIANTHKYIVHYTCIQHNSRAASARFEGERRILFVEYAGGLTFDAAGDAQAMHAAACSVDAAGERVERVAKHLALRVRSSPA